MQIQSIKKIETFLKAALKEDGISNDVTTNAILPIDSKGRARIKSLSKGVFCGEKVARTLVKLVDPKLKLTMQVKDGGTLSKQKTVLTLEGKLRSILKVERVLLNVLGHLSGIATLTRHFKQEAGRTDILDTRKTTPTLRGLERYAVLCGGGKNHRFNLSDQVLIKDNHIYAAKKLRGRDFKLSDLVEESKKKKKKVQIEVDTIDQLKEVLPAKPDFILLDNMSLTQLKKAVTLRNDFSKTSKSKRAVLEASGGVKLDTIKKIANTGVDRISVGALTHSSRHFNFSLELY